MVLIGSNSNLLTYNGPSWQQDQGDHSRQLHSGNTEKQRLFVAGVTTAHVFGYMLLIRRGALSSALPLLFLSNVAQGRIDNKTGRRIISIAGLSKSDHPRGRRPHVLVKESEAQLIFFFFLSCSYVLPRSSCSQSSA